MAKVRILIDDTEVKAKLGDKLLWVALDNGFYIPNLCAMRHPGSRAAACRLCFVEIGGLSAPVTACTARINDGMVVHLNTPKVKKMRDINFELLLAHHKLDCSHCVKNGKCELQNIARHLGLKLKLQKFKQIPVDLPVDSSHPLFTYDPNKCVICGKCIEVCQRNGIGALDFAFRGIHTRVGTIADIPLAETGCDGCLDCVTVCPVGALYAKPGITLSAVKL